MLMFPKVVSRLSLSPSALSDLVFYARRLRQESVTRTFSAIAAVLIVALQFFVIAAPPAPTNAASASDIIYGGFYSKDDLLSRYDSSAELQALYAHMGISRQDIVNTTEGEINSRDHSLNSLGRVLHAAEDQPVEVGGITYWARYLYQFDTGNNVYTGSYYRVLQGHRSSDGGYFAVIFHCGNIVFQSIPAPPPPPPPPPPPTPSPTPEATIACTKLQGSASSGEVPLTVSFTGSGTASGQALKEYQFDFGDGTAANQSGNAVTHQYIKAGTFKATLRVKGSKGKITPLADACSWTVTTTMPPAAFTRAKSALNVTQAVDATTKPAHAGDVIRYTLTTNNIGKSAGDYTVVEHIEDILEYATVTQAEGATQTGGILTWPVTSIEAGKSLVKTFTIKVKSPIPATPVGISDKFSYDLRMDNVYGNDVQIRLEPPLAKQVEGASTSLPDTGPGLSSTLVLGIAALVLYFYFRNRQLQTELKILRNQYQGAA